MIKRKTSLVLTSLILGIVGGLSFAMEPADSIIKNAEVDIVRYEQQAKGLTSNRKNNIKRIRKLMQISINRLTESSNQNHASWQAVNQRFLELDQQLSDLLLDKTQPSSDVAVPDADQSKSAAETNQASSVKPLVSGERVRVKKLVRDIDNLTARISDKGPSPLQDPAQVASLKKLFEQYKTALKRYPQVDDADVKKALNSFRGLQEKLKAEYGRAQAQLKTLGDVQQRLRQIESQQRQYAVPENLSIPFSEEAAKQWVEAASNARTVAEHSHKQLSEIEPLAWLPNNPGTPQTGSNYDSDDVRRMQQNAADGFNRVQSGYKQMNESLLQRMASIVETLNTRWQEDPTGEKSWIFTADNQQEEAFQFFDASLQIAESYVFLETALNRSVRKGLDLNETINRSKDAFINNRKIAISSARLPEAKSEDEERLAIARKILENPTYEFGEYGPVVLTTEKVVEREKKSSEIDIDDAEITLSGDLKLSGTETSWTYRWQEFKFAVPLKSDDGTAWHIWWIVAKKFSSGGNNTPLDRWISGKAGKGNPILEENF